MFSLPASAYNLLVPLYNSPNRHYHNLNHIQFCLSKVQEYYFHTMNSSENNFQWSSSLDNEYASLILAVWFHDAVYSPYPSPISSNESESQLLFYDWFRTYQADVSEGKTVIYYNASEAILATRNHLFDFAKEMLPVTQLMLDIDLSGFARSFDLVYNDSDLIFNEYSCLGLTREVMLENRVKFLQALLSKERIYYTDYFHETYETIARNNIQGIIELSLNELDK